VTATTTFLSTATITATPFGTAAATATGTAAQTVTATTTFLSTATITATPFGTATATGTAAQTVTATNTLPSTATTTATPFGTLTATPGASGTPTLTASPATIAIGAASGAPGSTVGFAVTLTTGAQSVAAVALSIGFDPLTPINVVDGKPDCTLSSQLDKQGGFAFEPTGCISGPDCRVSVVISGSTTPIPSGAMLFTCRVAIDPAAPLGNYPLPCTLASASNPQRESVNVVCTDGVVIVQNRLPGDCNGDGKVTIDELVTGVNIALGIEPLTACPAFDTNGDGQVTINELIAAVNVALNG
jgi:hypothetical protein